jgi:hypothetical protein
MSGSGQSPGTVPTLELATQSAAVGGRDIESLTFPRLLTIEAAARYLSVSPWLLRQYLQAGDLPVTRLPRPRTASALRGGARRPASDAVRVTLIDREALDEFVAGHCTRERLGAGVFPWREAAR